MRRWHGPGSWLVIAALALGVGPARATAGFLFTKIADTSTPIPGGTGDFTGFAVAPALSGSTAAFFGLGSGIQEGLYTGTGGTLTTIADTNTTIPGGTGSKYSSFASPSISGGTVAFSGLAVQSGGVYDGIAAERRPRSPI